MENPCSYTSKNLEPTELSKARSPYLVTGQHHTQLSLRQTHARTVTPSQCVVYAVSQGTEPPETETGFATPMCKCTSQCRHWLDTPRGFFNQEAGLFLGM